MRAHAALALTLSACGGPDASDDPTDPTQASTGEPAQSAWLHEFRQPTKFGAFDTYALAVADNGDIVATGTYAGTLEFAGASHVAISSADIWIARFTPDGTPLWFRRFGAPTDMSFGGAPPSAGNLTFAADHDILLTSLVFAAVDFGTGLLAGDQGDPVVLRLRPNGEVRWAWRAAGIGDEWEDFPMFVAPAADDRVWLVSALYARTVDLGGGPLTSAGWGDLLLTQLDADGQHLWSRRHGDAGHQQAHAVVPAPDGGLVITGHLEGTLKIGDTAISSIGLGDAFLVRLDAAGAPLWAHSYGDSFRQTGRQLAIDADGITLAGNFTSTIDVGGGPLTSAADPTAWSPDDAWHTAIFVARLDLAGEHRWSTALHADRGDATIGALARGSDGSLALAGYSQRRMLFAGEVTGTGEGPWFAALTPDGAPRWLQTVVGSPRVTVDGDAGVIAMFALDEPLDFAGTPIGAPGRASLVLARRPL